MSKQTKTRRAMLLVSDFNQTLSFNDSETVPSEMLGAPGILVPILQGIAGWNSLERFQWRPVLSVGGCRRSDVMDRGDIVFRYTDGVYDGSDEQGSLQIEQVIRSHKDEPAREIQFLVLAPRFGQQRFLSTRIGADHEYSTKRGQAGYELSGKLGLKCRSQSC